MANYEKRGDRIRARVTVPNSGGRREYKTFATKREARRWAEGIEDGDAVPVEKRTLNDLTDVYLETETPKKRGARWEKIRIARFRRKFSALFAKPLHEIRRQDIVDLIDTRLAEVKSSSVNRELNVLSAILTHGRRIEWMRNNPCETIKWLKEPPPRDRRITDEEITQMMKALDYAEGHPVTLQRHKVAVAFLLAIETAMRCGEMCQIRWSDVHLEKRWLFLRHDTTKTMQPRKIPLSSEAVRLINRLPRDGELMLGVSAAVLSTLFRRARDTRTDIVDLHFHDARHEACTRLAQILPTAFDLAKVSGHRNLNQILNTYYNRDASELAQHLP